jgi:hypothetical protein
VKPYEAVREIISYKDKIFASTENISFAILAVMTGTSDNDTVGILKTKIMQQ